MKIHYMPQQSPEWWEVRAGVPTASEFKRILSPKKCEANPSTQDKYIGELVSDRIMQLPPFFTENGRPETKEMRRGKETEAEARAWFALETGLDVKQVGFVTTDDGLLGCSPDGLVIGDDGQPSAGLELKCLMPAQHLKCLMEFKRTGTMPMEYRCQTHGGLIVTGLKEWFWVSYCPGAPEHICVCHKANEFTELLRAELTRFIARYEAAAASMSPSGEQT